MDKLWGMIRSPERRNKPAREHEILRCAGSITGKEIEQSANAARGEVLKWAQRRCGRLLPEQAWRFEEFEHFFGGRNCTGVRIKDAESDIWAIRADDPDKVVPGRIWTAEVVVGLMAGQQPLFSVRLLVSTAEEDLDITPHAPGCIQQVATTCGLSKGVYEISATPWVIESDEDADRLVDMLLDSGRGFPVFVLSVPEGAIDPDRPLLGASGLARATTGIGRVVVLPDVHTWSLTERLGKQRSVFGGAVRTYLPGFAADGDPYTHRLVLPDHLLNHDGAAQCQRWMCSLAAGESVRRAVLGRDVVAFSAIKNASLTLKLQRLEQEGASETDQLDAAKKRISMLEEEHNKMQSMLEYFDAEHEKAEERAAVAEEEARASAFRIQQLLKEKQASGQQVADDTQLPQSWGDFASWCDTELAGRVVLTPMARRILKSAEFDDIELAVRCLRWLATDGRDRRIDGGEGSLREEYVEDGVRNAHCGNDQFDLTWQGQRYTADWHIKNGGNTRNPNRCLRIYYFWDPASMRIVVAHMPSHRRTGAT